MVIKDSALYIEFARDIKTFTCDIMECGNKQVCSVKRIYFNFKPS